MLVKLRWAVVGAWAGNGKAIASKEGPDTCLEVPYVFICRSSVADVTSLSG